MLLPLAAVEPERSHPRPPVVSPDSSLHAAANGAAAENAAAVDQSATWVKETMPPSKGTRQPAFQETWPETEETLRSHINVRSRQDAAAAVVTNRRTLKSAENVEIAH